MFSQVLLFEVSGLIQDILDTNLKQSHPIQSKMTKQMANLKFDVIFQSVFKYLILVWVTECNDTENSTERLRRSFRHTRICSFFLQLFQKWDCDHALGFALFLLYINDTAYVVKHSVTRLYENVLKTWVIGWNCSAIFIHCFCGQEKTMRFNLKAILLCNSLYTILLCNSLYTTNSKTIPSIDTVKYLGFICIKMKIHYILSRASTASLFNAKRGIHLKRTKFINLRFLKPKWIVLFMIPRKGEYIWLMWKKSIPLTHWKSDDTVRVLLCYTRYLGMNSCMPSFTLFRHLCRQTG